jgi:paraquat-inducible protein B
MKAPEAVMRRYVVYFTESLRGLSVGAPVTLLGLTAGEVTDVGLELDQARGLIRPRAVITFYPERLITYADAAQKEKIESALKGNDKARIAFLQRLIDERGLRAQLRSGSLLTGQLYVAFDYFPKAPKVKVNWNRELPELPVMPSTLVDLEAKLTSILDKVEKMPLDEIGASLKKDLDSLDGTLASANKLITRVDETLVPSLKTNLDALQRSIGSFEKTLDSVGRTLENADATLLGPNAPAQQELRDALTEFTRAARSVRVLIDYLERHPESPIRGKVDMSGGK